MRFPRMRLLRGILVAVLLTGVSIAGAESFPVRAAGGAIKIGAFAPLTGPNASAGVDIIRSVKLAVTNANKTGGALGQKLTVDVQDSACNPQVASHAARKLVSDGVAGVIGPYCSSAALPASTIFHRAGMPMISPAATSPMLTEQGFNDIFRTIGRDNEQGVFVAHIMVNTLHAKRVAIIHDNSVYSRGLAEQTKTSLAKYKGVKVVSFDTIVSGSKIFNKTLGRIKTLKPDVTYFTGYYSDGGLLVKQFVQLGVPGRFLAGDANNDPAFIKLAGSYASKALIITVPTPDLVPPARAFVAQYRKTYHTDPGAYSTYAYDAANVLLWAIKKAHSTSHSAVITTLHQVKNLEGVTGPITFTAKGDRKQIQYIVETVRNGQFVRARM